MTNDELYNELKDIGKDDRASVIICDDCMNGHHEIAGHFTCVCSCHNNPTCFVCGAALINKYDVAEDCHVECQRAYDEQEANRVPNEPFGRYPWER